MDITGILRAGGKSRRMVKDKRFLELEGVSLFQRVLSVLDGIFPEVLVSVADPLPGNPSVHPSGYRGYHAGLWVHGWIVFRIEVGLTHKGLGGRLRYASVQSSRDRKICFPWRACRHRHDPIPARSSADARPVFQAMPALS